jgi:drug/metabolite transporter (DMT)-like permease
LNHLGEFLALATALIWAFGATLFGMAGRRSSAVLVNAIRLPAGGLLLWLAWVLSTGTFWPEGFTVKQHLWLGSSGALGLAVGDSFYYKGIMLAGPRRASLMLAATPVVAALVAWPVLGERLDVLAILGIAVVIGGIALATLGNDRGFGEHRDLPRGVILKGMAFAFVCAVCSALGNVLAKLGMPGDTPPLAATLVRGWWAVFAMGLFLAGRRSVFLQLPALRDRRVWRPLSIAVVLGPFLGMWAAVTSLKLTEAGVASVLMNTVPLTVMLPAWIFHRDRPSPTALLGVVIAVAGGALLFLR